MELAIKQKGLAIASIYNIGENHPIGVTHIFWPNVRFDQVEEQDLWLIGEKNGGYVGIWPSEKKEPYQDQIFDAAYRIYGRKTAYLCVHSDKSDCKDLKEFLFFCKSYQPRFYKETLTLTTKKDLSLIFKQAKDLTQII